MSKYDHDFGWAQQYMPQVKAILGPLLLSEAPIELDQSEATDLMVLKARDMRVGVRIRRPSYNRRYQDQFTLRLSRPSGARTEWEKVLYDGFGDWLFYARAAKGRLDPWMVVDLHALRGLFIRRHVTQWVNAGAVGKQHNGDGTSFVWVDARKIEAAGHRLLVASSGLDIRAPQQQERLRNAS